ncbi:MAG: nucleotide exchange factor GrpE [Candidatus Berkelbacteria bacterium]
MKKDKQAEELQQKIGELTAGWQRAQADFANFKRQAEMDRAKTIKFANLDLIMSLLPVLDNFQLAAKHVPENLANDNWVIGVRQIEKQLETVLAEEGLQKIESLGQQFDHNLHEAVEHIPSEKPEGEIVEEISAGYRYNDIIVRPAKVKVSNGVS